MELSHLMRIEKILVPVDFTDRCRHAGRYVADLARAYASEIILLHSIPPIDREVGLPDFASPALAGIVERRQQDRSEQLAEFLSEELAGLSVDRRLENGVPSEVILSVSEELPANLIVMPTHGYGPFRRFLLGSVTSQVLHDAHCPVLTTSHSEDLADHRIGPMQRILCAVDLGPRSEEALAWAQGFADDHNARLSLVHAIPSLPIHSTEFNYDPSWTRDESRTVREAVEALKEKAGAVGDVLIYIGDPHRVVREAALDSDADLVIIGRPTHGGVLGRLRENAYAIVRESPCPVISI